MERVGSERRDERLYRKEYGTDEAELALDHENDLIHEFHEVMMKTASYPSLQSTSSNLFAVLNDCYNSANAYTQRITKDGEKYAARLPVVRPSARLRTKSCSEWYEVRKATIAETKLKIRLQQEALELEAQRQCENKENASPPSAVAAY